MKAPFATQAQDEGIAEWVWRVVEDGIDSVSGSTVLCKIKVEMR